MGWSVCRVPPGQEELQPPHSVFRTHLLCFMAKEVTGGLRRLVGSVLVKDKTPTTRPPHTKGPLESPCGAAGPPYRHGPPKTGWTPCKVGSGVCLVAPNDRWQTKPHAVGREPITEGRAGCPQHPLTPPAPWGITLTLLPAQGHADRKSHPQFSEKCF